MSAVDLLRSLQLVMQAACPEANVLKGIPRQFFDPVLIYMWRDQAPRDVIKTTDTVRRHHSFHIHLLVQSVGDDEQAEETFYEVADRLSDAFQVNRRLLGLGANSTLEPKLLGAQYVLVDQAEYRACGWIWTAEEQLTFVFA